MKKFKKLNELDKGLAYCYALQHRDADYYTDESLGFSAIMTFEDEYYWDDVAIHGSLEGKDIIPASKDTCITTINFFIDPKTLHEVMGILNMLQGYLIRRLDET